MRRFLELLFACALTVASASTTRAAQAQTEPTAEELAAGRQLFAEALEDEEHQRYAEALEKYERVLKIKDTAAIRYRMGSCFEGLGKVRQAIDAYRAAVRTTSKSAGDAEIARASQARIDALEPKVARLSLKPHASGTATQIRVDDAPIPLESADDVRLDPGPHVVDAVSSSNQQFHAQVTLSEGARAELPLIFERAPIAERPPAPSSTSPLRTAGIVTGAAGAALVVAGAIVLVLRSSDIAELNESCPNGDCPRAREQELRDTRDRAVVQGPIGGTLVGVGAAALATGIVLVMLGRDGTSGARIAPAAHGVAGVGLTLAKGF